MAIDEEASSKAIGMPNTLYELNKIWRFTTNEQFHDMNTIPVYNREALVFDHLNKWDML